MSKGTTALAPVAESPIANYAICQPDAQDRLDAVRENLGDGGLRVFGLDRLKVPSGGGTMWMVPTVSGDEPAKEVEGVVVYQRPIIKQFWAKSMEESGGGGPPDCFSDDGKIGKGDPGGVCANCAHNEWGSGKNGGKACPDKRLLCILRPDSILPLLLVVPAGSSRVVTDYFKRLAGQGLYYYSVVTRFSLVQARSNTNILYAQIVPTMVARIPREEEMRVKRYSEDLRAAMSTLSAADLAEDGTLIEAEAA
jgi:hypothetical protein